MALDFTRALRLKRLGCLVPGCSEQSVLDRVGPRNGRYRTIVIGYCAYHVEVRKGRTHCIVDGCDGECVLKRSVKKYSSGFCATHYREMLSKTYRPAEPKVKPKRKIANSGYAFVLVGTSYRHEHRVVMEDTLGRPLTKDESVHHINGRRADNRPENLELIVGPIWSGVRSRELNCPHCGKPYSLKTS